MAASVLESGLIPLDRTIYPEECLHTAIGAYRDFLEVEALGGNDLTRTVEVRIKQAHHPEAPQVRKEFLNYLLDVSIQHHLKRS